jgi:VWFA-related protein
LNVAITLQPKERFTRILDKDIVQLLRYSLLLALVCECDAQDATFSSDVKVVSLLATVRERSGAIVKSLTKDDFRLEEDGQPQTIRYFSRESDLPLTLALLVDTSRSMRTVFEPERVASNQFLDQVLREDRDVAAVVHFDIRVGVLQGLTSSRENLAAALDELRIPAIPSTRLYDAIRQASEDLMRKQNGRKAFILLSDGMDVRSHTSIGTAIEYAQRADTMIYSILFAHRRNRPGRGVTIVIGPNPNRGPKVMERLARETGGGYFEVSNDNSIDNIYAQIEDELRNQYSIGYTPDRTDADGRYRKIKLTAVQKDMFVRTRDGYFPK